MATKAEVASHKRKREDDSELSPNTVMPPIKKSKNDSNGESKLSGAFEELLSLSDLDLSEKYRIYPDRGFTPITCSSKLSDYYSAWDHTVAKLPYLNNNSSLRNEVKRWPILSIDHLHSPEDKERAFSILCSVGAAYIYGNKDQDIINKVPPQLSHPWCDLADELNRPPVSSYTSTAMCNWELKDGETELKESNMNLLCGIEGKEDEKLFLLLSVEINAIGGKVIFPLIHSLREIQSSPDSDATVELVKSTLNATNTTFAQMLETFRKMEKMDPHSFYFDVRPYLGGWKNNSRLPDGVVYEGRYNDESQFFSGASAAQAPDFHFFDILFSVKHESEYLGEMWQYMVEEHRELLKTLEGQDVLKEYCETREPLWEVSTCLHILSNII
eukprot:TRINITY_DN7217_c0_g1_i3.p1 TRINITY_DN7217_c0_g1~~TRINITY_DN7217_c0_g1_i3.p1  ORF type:complete len:386 (-),score=71.44 TRINITY_DN7217_c0_g1_i3:203-1360(-)